VTWVFTPEVIARFVGAGLRGEKQGAKKGGIGDDFKVRRAGIEPATPGLKVWSLLLTFTFAFFSLPFTISDTFSDPLIFI